MPDRIEEAKMNETAKNETSEYPFADSVERLEVFLDSDLFDKGFRARLLDRLLVCFPATDSGAIAVSLRDDYRQMYNECGIGGHDCITFVKINPYAESFGTFDLNDAMDVQLETERDVKEYVMFLVSML